MEGMTISEMAKALNLPRKTVEMRILRRGHKPITHEATYSKEVFEDIKNVPGKGRPKKKPEAESKPEAK
jgi:hypothetical protein